MGAAVEEICKNIAHDNSFFNSWGLAGGRKKGRGLPNHTIIQHRFLFLKEEIDRQIGNRLDEQTCMKYLLCASPSSGAQGCIRELMKHHSP